MLKADLKDRSDIDLLVQEFYAELLAEDEFHHLFIEVAGIQIEEHFELLGDFWERVLFGTGSYSRNTMQVHLDLHMKHRLEESTFEHWLTIFSQTVDSLFTGENAQEIKTKARSIANVIMMKINNLDRIRLELNN